MLQSQSTASLSSVRKQKTLLFRAYGESLMIARIITKKREGHVLCFDGHGFSNLQFDRMTYPEYATLLHHYLFTVNKSRFAHAVYYLPLIASSHITCNSHTSLYWTCAMVVAFTN
jgi:hypothetical protein